MDNLKDKSIWIAGHTGLVGSACMRVFEGRGCKNLLTVPHGDLDLTRQKDTENWMQAQKPEMIIMAAAHVGGIQANINQPSQMISENLAIAQNVITAAHGIGVEKLIYLGSSCIYPPQDNKPLKTEDLMARPLEKSNEFYAVAKIAGVKLCEAYRRQYKDDFISVMPCNLYGLGDTYDEVNSHVIPALIMKLHKAKQEKKGEVSLWGTGEALREFLYADDLAEALYMLLCKSNADNLINIGSSSEVSIQSLARKIASVVGYEGRINFDTSKPDGTQRKLMDSSYIRSLDWEPSTQLDDGIKIAYQDFLKRH